MSSEYYLMIVVFVVIGFIAWFWPVGSNSSGKIPCPDNAKKGEKHFDGNKWSIHNGYGFVAYGHCKKCEKLLIGSKSFFSLCADCKWEGKIRIDTNPRNKPVLPEVNCDTPMPECKEPKKEPIDYMVIMGANARIDPELQKEINLHLKDIRYMQEDMKLTLEWLEESGRV